MLAISHTEATPENWLIQLFLVAVLIMVMHFLTKKRD
jgi:hypothetical protein